MSSLSRILALGAMCAACGDAGSVDPHSGPAGDAAPAAVDAIPAPDAAIVQCEADHQESRESSNDGILNPDNGVEPTGLILSGQNNFSICGEIATDQAAEDFSDVDVYEFQISGTQATRLHFSAESAAGLEGLEFVLFGAEGPSTIATARIQGRHALISRPLGAGTYWIAVLAKGSAPSVAIPYRIEGSKTPLDCNMVAGPADYSESLDGALSRENDTLTIQYSQGQTFMPTSSDSDAPEATGLTLSVAESKSITGTSADVEALDDYRDRDAYQIRTGSLTTELSLRLSWPHDQGLDFDLHIFAAGVPVPDLSSGAAAKVGTTEDELTTMAVLPDTDYWIWLGLYDGPSDEALPQDYTLTLCADSL